MMLYTCSNAYHVYIILTVYLERVFTYNSFTAWLLDLAKGICQILPTPQYFMFKFQCFD
jgi:hypothetical protein